MAHDRIDAPTLPAEPLNPATVLAYLQRHPDFLIEHPALLSVLNPPARTIGEGVIDLQQAVVQRLKAENARLRLREHNLMSAGKDNQTTQVRVQAAALALLRARSFEALIRIIATDLPKILHLSAVTLCVEAAEDTLSTRDTAGIRVIAPGSIDRVLGRDVSIGLRANTPGDPVIFGLHAGEVRSVAFLRLSFGTSAPGGLMALGAADAQTFQPRLETQLVDFLARVMELCIRRWLQAEG